MQQKYRMLVASAIIFGTEELNPQWRDMQRSWNMCITKFKYCQYVTETVLLTLRQTLHMPYTNNHALCLLLQCMP